MLAGAALDGLFGDVRDLWAKRVQQILQLPAGRVVEDDEPGVATIGIRQRQDAAALQEAEEQIVGVVVGVDRLVEVLDRAADPALVDQLDDAGTVESPDVVGHETDVDAGDLGQPGGAERSTVGAHGVHDQVTDGIGQQAPGALRDVRSGRQSANLLSQGRCLDSL